MRAVELKRKYPTFWKEIESLVLHDVKDQTSDCPIPITRARVIAHNAAFNAVFAHHKATKKAK